MKSFIQTAIMSANRVSKNSTATKRVRSVQPTVPMQRSVVVRVPKAPKRPTVVSGTGFDLNKVVSDVSSTFISGLNKPLVLLTLVLVVALVFTHVNDFSSGVVGKWVSDKSASNSLALWVHQNLVKFLGLTIFIPAVLDSPEKLRVALALACVFWVMLVPQASIYEYAIQAIALHTYFRVKLQNSRVFILLVVAALYFFGHITLTTPSNTMPANNSTVPQ
ncbi:putative virion membrane protein [Mekrijarvi negevirus]|uniref:Virion membrane protein n=1 Tax=Mekrijarvi negevirus TaxID=2778782 RepID=A0A7L9QAF0_9VIRU|nr:putative virion membrane protein [Mekrijarvi negevirus]